MPDDLCQRVEDSLDDLLECFERECFEGECFAGEPGMVLTGLRLEALHEISGDREDPSFRDLFDHLSDCARCRESLDGYRKTALLVRNLPDVQLPNCFLSWVRGRVHSLDVVQSFDRSPARIAQQGDPGPEDASSVAGTSGVRLDPEDCEASHPAVTRPSGARTGRPEIGRAGNGWAASVLLVASVFLVASLGVYLSRDLDGQHSPGQDVVGEGLGVVDVTASRAFGEEFPGESDVDAVAHAHPSRDSDGFRRAVAKFAVHSDPVMMSQVNSLRGRLEDQFEAEDVDVRTEADSYFILCRLPRLRMGQLGREVDRLSIDWTTRHDPTVTAMMAPPDNLADLALLVNRQPNTMSTAKTSPSDPENQEGDVVVPVARGATPPGGSTPIGEWMEMQKPMPERSGESPQIRSPRAESPRPGSPRAEFPRGRSSRRRGSGDSLSGDEDLSNDWIHVEICIPRKKT